MADYPFAHCLPRTNKKPMKPWICLICGFPVVVEDPTLKMKLVAEHVEDCIRDSRVG